MTHRLSVETLEVIRSYATAAKNETLPVSASTVLALVAEVIELRKANEWQDIATAPKDRTAVLIAVPDQHRTKYMVGEAYFDPENYDGGDWWWAGTDYGDYHGGPISEMNHHLPELWCPIPVPAALPTQPQAEPEVEI